MPKKKSLDGGPTGPICPEIILILELLMKTSRPLREGGRGGGGFGIPMKKFFLDPVAILWAFFISMSPGCRIIR